jgi:hypothetical protein
MAVPTAARAWWAISAVVSLVSLGMPWGGSTLWPIYNVYNPWNCGVDFSDGDSFVGAGQWCFQSLPTYSWFEGEAGAGYQTPARLFVALALIAVFLGVRSARRPLILLGAAIATAGALLAGRSVGPGQTVYFCGVLALWIGVHRAGFIAMPRRHAPTGWPPAPRRLDGPVR